MCQAYSSIPEWQRYRQLMQEVRANREKANCVGGGRQRQLLAIAAAKERQAEELKKKAMEIYSVSSINTNTTTPTTTPGLAQAKVTAPPSSQYPRHHEHPPGGGIPEDRGKRESSSVPPPVKSRPKTCDEPSFASSLDYEEETVVVPQEQVLEGMSSRQLHRNFGLMDEGQQQQEHVFDFTRHFEAVSPPPLPESLPIKTYPLQGRDSSTITTTTLPHLGVSDRKYHLGRQERDLPEEREVDPANPVFIAQKGDHRQPPCPVALPPPRLTRFSTQQEEDEEDEPQGHLSHDLKNQRAGNGTVNDSRRDGGSENLALNIVSYSRTTTPTVASMSIKRTITTSSSGCALPSDTTVRAPYLAGPGGEGGVGSSRELEQTCQHQERNGIEGVNSGGTKENHLSLHDPIALEELRRHQDALQRQLKLVEAQLLLHTQREVHEGQQRRSEEAMPPGIKGYSRPAPQGTGDFSSLVEERTTKVELPQ